MHFEEVSDSTYSVIEKNLHSGKLSCTKTGSKISRLKERAVNHAGSL